MNIPNPFFASTPTIAQHRTMQAAQKALALFDKGKTNTEIALELNYSESHIYRLINWANEKRNKDGVQLVPVLPIPPTERYVTHDIGFIAFLLLNKITELSCTYNSSVGRVYFSFEKTEVIEQLSDAYYNRDAVAGALKLSVAMREIKQKINQAMSKLSR